MGNWTWPKLTGSDTTGCPARVRVEPGRVEEKGGQAAAGMRFPRVAGKGRPASSDEPTWKLKHCFKKKLKHKTLYSPAWTENWRVLLHHLPPAWKLTCTTTPPASYRCRSLEPNSHSSINSNGTNLDTDQTEEHRVSSVSYKHDTAIEPSFGLYASSLSETINPRVPSGHHYSVADEPASTTSPPPIWVRDDWMAPRPHSLASAKKKKQTQATRGWQMTLVGLKLMFYIIHKT